MSPTRTGRERCGQHAAQRERKGVTDAGKVSIGDHGSGGLWPKNPAHSENVPAMDSGDGENTLTAPGMEHSRGGARSLG